MIPTAPLTIFITPDAFGKEELLGLVRLVGKFGTRTRAPFITLNLRERER